MLRSHSQRKECPSNVLKLLLYTDCMKKKIQVFQPLKVIDPLTGKEIVLSPEEQEEMLERGIMLAPSRKKKPTNSAPSKDES